MPLSQLLQRSSGELQAELQLILNAVVEGLCGVDAHGNATFCNEALLRMTGYRTEELIGNNLHTLVHHSRPDGTKYPEGSAGCGRHLMPARKFMSQANLFGGRTGLVFQRNTGRIHCSSLRA